MNHVEKRFEAPAALSVEQLWRLIGLFKRLGVDVTQLEGDWDLALDAALDRIRDLLKVEQIGREAGAILPDGSACFTASWPLPQRHWLYEELGEPPSELWAGPSAPKTPGELVVMVREAARYAVKSATANGTIRDFDPDAMVQAFSLSLLGPSPIAAAVSMREERERTEGGLGVRRG